tara:strand:- start:149 stop:292 length:144 start_codon:yes stop_codon:yes gene_type:complete
MKTDIASLDFRLAALEKLVLKQHEIIGILINAGKRMEKEMKEDEEED